MINKRRGIHVLNRKLLKSKHSTHALISNHKNNLLKSKRSQIWVETVIYTLIGLTILAVIIGIAQPKINAYRDKIVIDNSLEMMNKLDEQVEEVKLVVGQARKLQLNIKKGEIKIDGQNDEILFEMESNKKYSEPGEEIQNGKIKILTEEVEENFKVSLKLEYNNLNITYNEKDSVGVLQEASQPYEIIVRNVGSFDGKSNIDISY